MEETKKKRWNWTVVLCVVLLGLNLWQGKRISDLEQDIWNAQNSVMDNVNRISQQFSSLGSELESANDLVREWSYVSAVNKERRSLDIEISLVLKEWQADTAVELLVMRPSWSDSNAGETAVPLSGDGAGTFAGTVPLTPRGLSGEYTLDAVITNGGTQRRESLGWLGDVTGLLPIQCYGWGVGGPNYTRNADQSGVLTVTSCEAELTGQDGSPPELTDQAFRLRRNGNIMAEKTAMFGSTIEQYTCEELSAEAGIGDEFLLSFFCRDESGLCYEFCLCRWSIDENGLGEIAEPEENWPQLTWD